MAITGYGRGLAAAIVQIYSIEFATNAVSSTSIKV